MERLFCKSLIGLFLFSFLGSTTLYAAVQAPFVNIQDLSTNAGTMSSSGNLTIDATALSVTTVDGSSHPISDGFSLTGRFSGFSNSAYNYSGTVSIGTILSATFDNLFINQISSNSAVFSADLTYVGGSDIVGLASGRLEGALYGISGLLDGDFTATDTFISVGEIISPVPLPAALWLFMPMLAGLFGMGYRNKNKYS